MLFYASNPWVFHDKFRKFADAPADARRMKDFLAIEQWVNDGVPMTQALARECLIDWVQHNAPARDAWTVGGERIRPEAIRCPVFVAAPQGDRIVPAGCALPLAARLKYATLVAPSSGHVGMMVGHRRQAEFWKPFAAWCDAQSKSLYNRA
jgi:poly(3-hydroxyalkanoate) synthetase